MQVIVGALVSSCVFLGKRCFIKSNQIETQLRVCIISQLLSCWKKSNFIDHSSLFEDTLLQVKCKHACIVYISHRKTLNDAIALYLGKYQAALLFCIFLNQTLRLDETSSFFLDRSPDLIFTR